MSDLKTRMLYHKGGADLIDGHMVSYKLFPVAEVGAALSQGWAKTPAGSYEPKKRGRKPKKEKADGMD